ncbi:MAG: methylthioxylose transferase [Pseudonocardiales bacterium]|nr:methylthioxylose transferase [Pseudonocardiales bacterium]
MTDVAPPATGRRALIGDLVAVAAGVVLVLLSSVDGWALIRAGQDIILGFPPLLATWMPHVGPGTPIAIVVAVLVATRGPGLAERLSWRPLLFLSWAAAFVWTFGLALVDGWQRGVVERLSSSQEYLNDVPKVGDIGEMLRTFSDHILTNQPVFWTTHVGAHPPGAFLLFVWLDRIGLGGGGPAGVAVMLAGASACAAVAVTLRALGHEATARAVLPFSVLFPGAVWVGVSADGVFAAVLAWGVALLAVGSARRGPRADGAALVGGVLLGYTLYLSYGLALGGLLPLAVVAARSLGGARVDAAPRPSRAAGFAVVGALAVAVAFTAAGFWWVTGYEDVKVIYAHSAAKDRPYSYFVWADLAALVLATGPAVLAGLRRLVASRRALPLAASLLVAAAAAAVLAADLSGLSKAEVERIWLPFGVWLLVACALLPRRHVRWWLVGQAVLALAVNHLLFTVW